MVLWGFLAPAAPQNPEGFDDDLLGGGALCLQQLPNLLKVLVYFLCFVASVAPQSPESVDDAFCFFARMEGTTGIPHRHIKVTHPAPAAPLQLQRRAV